MFSNIHLACVSTVYLWGRRIIWWENWFSLSHGGNLIFIWAMSWVLSELEIHSYMAKIFLPFLWQKYIEQHLTWLNVVTWPHTGKTWCCNSLAVFLLWLTLTVNMPAVSKSTLPLRAPQPGPGSHIETICSLSRQTEGKMHPSFAP